MKIKKEYIFLALVIGVLAGYLLQREPNRTHYHLPEVSPLDGKGVSKIEIITPEESIVLNRQDAAWVIAPKAYPADSNRVQEMLRVMGNLSVTAMVSSSKSYERYDLSDNRKIHVKAWVGDDIGLEFDVGKRASTYQHTYVRFPEDSNVYQAGGDLRTIFENKSQTLRDRSVLSFIKEDIREIQINQGEKSMLIRRKAIPIEKDKTDIDNATGTRTTETAAVWETADGKKVDEFRVSQALLPLADLNCQKYIENKTKPDFKDPQYSVQLQGTEELFLWIFDRNDGEAESYAAVSSQNDYPFFLSKHQVENIKEKIEQMMQ